MEWLLESELLKVSKVAEICDVEVGTVYKWIDRGILPAVKIGRTVRVDAAELRRLIKGRPSTAAIVKQIQIHKCPCFRVLPKKLFLPRRVETRNGLTWIKKTFTIHAQKGTFRGPGALHFYCTGF